MVGNNLPITALYIKLTIHFSLPEEADGTGDTETHISLLSENMKLWLCNVEQSMRERRWSDKNCQ